MWFSGSSCYFSRGSSTIRQDHHFATKTPGKQKRFPSGPEPKRVCLKGFCGFLVVFFRDVFWWIMQNILQYVERFFESKNIKANCTVFHRFQTSRFGDFFLPFPRWIFAAALGGILFLFPCENWGISEFQTLSHEILMGE